MGQDRYLCPMALELLFNRAVFSLPPDKFCPSSSPVGSSQRSGKLGGFVGQVGPAVLDPLGHVLHDGLNVDQLEHGQ